VIGTSPSVLPLLSFPAEIKLRGGPRMFALYAGLDVPLESTSGCVVDADGRMVRECKLPWTRIRLSASFEQLRAALSGSAMRPRLCRIG
jgi:hypothetical protein